MRKLYVNRDPVAGPWGGGNAFRVALETHSEKFGWKVIGNLSTRPDAILVMGLGPEGRHPGFADVRRYAMNAGVLTTIRCNENDARKGTKSVDDAWHAAMLGSDRVVFVSRWLSEYFVWPTDGKSSFIVKNGVDTNTFNPGRAALRATFPAVDRGRFIPCVVTHHWSGHPLKGNDVYEFLDGLAGNGKISFTYIGRTSARLPNSRIVPPKLGIELAEELASNDVYVSGSRWDPGPNHILEALACGLPTYVHPDGGGSVEFAGVDHVYLGLEDLERILRNRSYVPNSVTVPSWEECVADILTVCGGSPCSRLS